MQPKKEEESGQCRTMVLYPARKVNQLTSLSSQNSTEQHPLKASHTHMPSTVPGPWKQYSHTTSLLSSHRSFALLLHYLIQTYTLSKTSEMKLCRL